MWEPRQTAGLLYTTSSHAPPQAGWRMMLAYEQGGNTLRNEHRGYLLSIPAAAH